MFGRSKKQKSNNEIYSLVYIYGRWKRYTYLNPDNLEVGTLVLVNVTGKLYAGRIIDSSPNRPENTQDVVFKPIIKTLSIEDRSKTESWNSAIEESFPGKHSKMPKAVKKEYDSILSDIDGILAKSAEYDKANFVELAKYMKGETKTKKDAYAAIQESKSSPEPFYERMNTIKDKLLESECLVLEQKITSLSKRYDTFMTILDRIDTKTKAIKPPADEHQKERANPQIEKALTDSLKLSN